MKYMALLEKFCYRKSGSRIEKLRGKINLTYGDLLDTSSIDRILKNSNPDEIYNLAAQVM